MSENNEEFRVDKSENQLPQKDGSRVIDESNYQIHAPKEKNPSVIGNGGDPLFMNIRATRTQLEDLLEETTTIQDWVQRETSNNVALACLNNENLKEIYFEIKDGFGEYGPILLMGFKTPQGVEIPRLKILDKNGEVIQVLTGPMAIDELNKRAIEYKEITATTASYEKIVDLPEEVEETLGPIEDYK